jgi:hypothetical protein
MRTKTRLGIRTLMCKSRTNQPVVYSAPLHRYSAMGLFFMAMHQNIHMKTPFAV